MNSQKYRPFIVRALLVAFAGVLLSACGGGSDTPDPVTTNDAVAAPPGGIAPPAPPGGGGTGGEGQSPADPAGMPAPDTQSPPLADGADSTPTELEGLWQTGCIAAPEAESAPGQFIFSATFEGAQSSITRSQYIDDNCTQLFVEFVTVGTWATAGRVLTPSGFQALQVDTQVQSIAVAYYDEQTVSNLNAAGYCGSVLEVGVRTEVTECLLEQGFTERNTSGLYMIASGVLYPGDASTGDGSSPENRPTDVDFTQAHLPVTP